MQQHCGIESDDKVKLLRMYKDHEMECALVAYDRRSMRVGCNYFAESIISGRGFRLRDKPGGACAGFAPFFCLELVEKAKPEPPPIMVGGREVIFGDEVIKVCGIAVSKGTLQDILKRLEEKN